MNAVVTEILKKGESQAALDTKGNMVGLRAGCTKDRSNRTERFLETNSFVKWLFVTMARVLNGSRLAEFNKVTEALDFDS